MITVFIYEEGAVCVSTLVEGVINAPISVEGVISTSTLVEGFLIRLSHGMGGCSASSIAGGV